MGAIRRDKLGMLITREDGSVGYFAKAHAALVAGQPYIITPTTESVTVEGVAVVSGIAVTEAPTAVATVSRRCGVADKAYATGDIAFLIAGGEVEAKVEGTTDVVSGDFLKLAPGTTATALIKDGTTETNSSVALAVDAQAANSEVIVTVMMLGTTHKVINT